MAYFLPSIRARGGEPRIRVRQIHLLSVSRWLRATLQSLTALILTLVVSCDVLVSSRGRV